MEQSPLLNEIIFRILNRTLPSQDEISQMTIDEKKKLETQQEQILELFQNKILEIIDNYQHKLKSMANEIQSIEQTNQTIKQKQKTEKQSETNHFEFENLSDRQLKERLKQVQKELKAMRTVISKKPKRKAWK